MSLFCYLQEISQVLGKEVPYKKKRGDQQVILSLGRHERPPRPVVMSDLSWSLVECCCTIDRNSRRPLKDVRESLRIQLFAVTVRHGLKVS